MLFKLFEKFEMEREKEGRHCPCYLSEFKQYHSLIKMEKGKEVGGLGWTKGKGEMMM